MHVKAMEKIALWPAFRIARDVADLIAAFSYTWRLVSYFLVSRDSLVKCCTASTFNNESVAEEAASLSALFISLRKGSRHCVVIMVNAVYDVMVAMVVKAYETP